MHPNHAPAWRADWINGWLAAIGCIILCDDIQLSWTEDARPTAILWTPHVTTLDEVSHRIAEAFPPSNFVTTTSARHLKAQVPDEALYAFASDDARQNGDWLWSSLFTDLGPVKGTPIARSIFYPGTEGATGIGHRMQSLAPSWSDAAAIRASMLGELSRAKGGGLGFDPRRILDPAYPKYKEQGLSTDPVVEALALFSTIMFPVRGNGKRDVTRGEGFHRRPFRWNTWGEPLDAMSIDARFGQPRQGDTKYELVAYSKRGNETKAAYFSRKLPK